MTTVYLEAEDLGRRIAEMRNERGLSQRELADLISLDASAVSRIESGARGLSARELIVLAKAFDVSPDEVLRRQRDPAPLFRNEGGEEAAGAALEAALGVIEDFFALEATAQA